MESENMVADYFSRLENVGEPLEVVIHEIFPNKLLLAIKVQILW